MRLTKSAQLLAGLTLAGCNCPQKYAKKCSTCFKIGACDRTLKKQDCLDLREYTAAELK